MKKGYVVGFGGYGKQFLSRMQNETDLAFQLVSVDTHEATILVSSSEEAFIQHPAIQQLVVEAKEAPCIYLVAGAGGSFGSYFSLLFAELLKDYKGNCTILCTKPFSFEGKQKEAIACGMESVMKEMGYSYVSLKNDQLSQLFANKEDKMRLYDVFYQADQHFIDLIKRDSRQIKKADVYAHTDH